MYVALQLSHFENFKYDSTPKHHHWNLCGLGQACSGGETRVPK
ncbi:hypothetical protein CZ765_03735 [Corynebacterium casei]|nr:hypothetical protein CZ765_03735 [Corynebacterium casei]